MHLFQTSRGDPRTSTRSGATNKHLAVAPKFPDLARMREVEWPNGAGSMAILPSGSIKVRFRLGPIGALRGNFGLFSTPSGI